MIEDHVEWYNMIFFIKWFESWNPPYERMNKDIGSEISVVWKQKWESIWMCIAISDPTRANLQYGEIHRREIVLVKLYKLIC